MSEGKPESFARRRALEQIAGVAEKTVLALMLTPVFVGAAKDIVHDVKSMHTKFLERRRLIARGGWEGWSSHEKERVIEHEVREFNALLQRYGTRILESSESTDDSVESVLSAMPWYTRAQLAGTTYDFDPGCWPSVSLARTFASIHADESISVARLDVTGLTPHIGNGVWVRMPDGKLSLLTNIHVLTRIVEIDGLMDTTAIEEVKRDEGIDAVYIRFTDDVLARLEAAGHVPREFAFKDIPENDVVHGMLVRMPAIDRDATSAADGTKLYASVALRMTERLRRFFKDHSVFSNSVIGEVGFVYAAPPGETRPFEDRRRFLARLLTKSAPGRGASTPAHGTSGSPMVGSIGGVDVLVGTNSAIAGRVERFGIVLDLMGFDGPGVIVPAGEHGLVLDMNNPPLRKGLPSNYEGSGYEYEDNGGWSDLASDK